MISCDIVYPKVMSVNFQALFGVLIEKSIGYRVSYSSFRIFHQLASGVSQCDLQLLLKSLRHLTPERKPKPHRTTKRDGPADGR